MGMSKNFSIGTLLFKIHQWLQDESEVDIESEYNSSRAAVDSDEITYNGEWSQSNYHNAKKNILYVDIGTVV